MPPKHPVPRSDPSENPLRNSSSAQELTNSLLPQKSVQQEVEKIIPKGQDHDCYEYFERAEKCGHELVINGPNLMRRCAGRKKDGKCVHTERGWPNKVEHKTQKALDYCNAPTCSVKQEHDKKATNRADIAAGKVEPGPGDLEGGDKLKTRASRLSHDISANRDDC